MTVQTNNPKVVYIHMDGITYYIDHSMSEPIIQMWKEDEQKAKVINLIKEKEA